MFSNRTKEIVSNAATPTEESAEVDASGFARSWDKAMYLMANPFLNWWIGP